MNANASVTKISELGDGSCILPNILKEPVAKVFAPPPEDSSHTMKKLVEFKDIDNNNNDDDADEEETKQEELLSPEQHSILEQSLENEGWQNDFQLAWTSWSKRRKRYECHLQCRVPYSVSSWWSHVSTLLIILMLLFCMNGIWNLELQTRSVLDG
jgi:hypothetical protein